MKVLYFHQHFSTPLGSTGTRSYEMAKKLVASGHEVIMVCGSYGGGDTGLSNEFIHGVRRGIVDGFEVVEFKLEYSNAQSFKERTKAFIIFALRSIKIVFTEKYDLLFATTTPLTAALPGIVAHWLKRKRFVFEVRDLWPELPKAMGVIKNPLILIAMSGLEWLAYKSAYSLIGLSPGIKKGISRHGIPEERIAMIPNGCDFSIFETNDKAWQPEGVNDNDLMAIFTGTHGIANGLDIVIDTARELKTRGRDDIKIVLIGQGKIKQNLVNRVDMLNLENVIFLEPVNKSKLARLMKRADVGLQLLANIPAFYYGTSPNKFFDYISAGLPVLNNYPGWIAEMISESNCGITIPPENKLAFADALIHLSENRELLPTMGIAAKKLAKQRFSREKLSTEFVTWLEKRDW